MAQAQPTNDDVVRSTGTDLLGDALRRSAIPVVVQDHTGAVVDHNPALAELVGLTADELDGRSTIGLLAEVFHDDGRPFSSDDLPGRVAIRTGEPRRNVIMRVRRHDGERRLLQVTSIPFTLPADATPCHGDGKSNDNGRDHGDRTDLTADLVLTFMVDLTKDSVVPSDWRDAEDRFRLLADAVPIGIFVAGPDGRTLYGNRQAEINTGRTMEEIQRLGWADFIHPEDVAATAREQRRAIAAGDEFVAEYRLVRPDGSTPWVRSRGGQILGPAGEVLAFIGTITDVTEVHEAHERLREREALTNAIIESAAEGIVSVDEQGRIIRFNAAAERIFGWSSDDAVGRHDFLVLLAPATREVFGRWWRDHLDGAPARLIGAPPREVVGLHADGHEVPIELVVTEIETEEGRIFTGMVRDLSQHKALTAELEHRATHDEVTGLPNRLLLTAQLEVAVARARRRSQVVAVLSVLIDRVAMVQSSLGHDAADELLADAAGRLRKAVDPAAVIGRSAHDQFLVVIDELDAIGDAVEAAQAIIEAVNQPFLLDGEEAFATAFVGIAAGPDARDGAALITDANVAMRRAVESSVTRFELFDHDMRAAVDAARRDEIALRHAIQRDELRLHLQPVVELATGLRVGAEALVRWQRSDELVLPDRFIPLAEESGLIIELGAWVIRAACAQLAEWEANPPELHGPVPVSVNLSGRQLAHPDLVATVADAISTFGVDPAMLAFEITETVLLVDVDHAVATLDALRALGVSISLDDFGTGYSSLTYLCRFPIDVVKIDRSFVSEGPDINEPVVTMILGLAETLGLDVVAEGVETEIQAESLRMLGCPKAQGYLYARPAPPDAW